MLAADGKMRMTDVADTEQLLRVVQSIPSPKAESFKVWLASVGFEQLESKTGREVVSPLSARRFFEAQQVNEEIANKDEEKQNNE